MSSRPIPLTRCVARTEGVRRESVCVVPRQGPLSVAPVPNAYRPIRVKHINTVRRSLKSALPVLRGGFRQLEYQIQALTPPTAPYHIQVKVSEFVKAHLGERPGPMIEIETGQVQPHPPPFTLAAAALHTRSRACTPSIPRGAAAANVS
jgi:hypothetical protein